MNPLSRRRFLKVSAGSAAALGVGGYLWSLSSDRHYARILGDTRPKVLTEKELAVLTIFCEVVIDARPTPREVRVAERIDRELAFHPARLQKDVKNAIFLVEHGAVAHFRFTRFSKQRRGRQVDWISRMRHGSDLERQAFAGLRLLAMFYYYCDERTWSGIHYDGPLVQIASPPEADSALRKA